MDSPLPERQYFGRYETLFPIATGGMAEVYAARVRGEAGFQKLVALKRMRPELAEDARFVSMFLDEGRIAANISSPNVVATLDLGRAEDNSLYLVMELVTGVSVASILQEAAIRQERIPVPIAVEIVAQAASGLHDAHEAKAPGGAALEIIHRDCSPHNILVDVGGQVKITDFGIAKAMERQTTSQAGEMKGKLSYLSPEQARGQDVDRRVDVFILGIVAWEFIAQRRLFTGTSAVEALHKVTSMPIPRLDVVRKGVPERVADAVAQALVRNVDERFATCAAFCNALRSSNPERPKRSEISAFVRANAGNTLAEIERKIRLTFGTESQPPLPAVPPHPIPLVAPKADIAEPLTPPPLEFTDPTDADATPGPPAESLDASDTSGLESGDAPGVAAATIQMNALQIAGIERLEKYPSDLNPIDLLKSDTIPETDLDAAELERLRHPDPLPGQTAIGFPSVAGLRDDQTEPELRSVLHGKRRGMSGSISPPAMPPDSPDSPDSPDTPPELGPYLQKRTSLRWFMIAFAVLLAGGGGAVAAWWVRTNGSIDEDVLDVAAPVGESHEVEGEPPLEVALPDEPIPPPVVPTPPHAEVVEALGADDEEAAAPPRPRRRRGNRQVPDTLGAGTEGGGMVTGSRPPEGDRRAAFEEIPW